MESVAVAIAITTQNRELDRGALGKIVINLGETCKKTKFTPPSPTKATPNYITSNEKYLSMTSVSDGDDVLMTSSTQNESNKITQYSS